MELYIRRENMENTEAKKSIEHCDLEKILDAQLLLLSEFSHRKDVNPEHLITCSYAMCELTTAIRKTHTKSLYS